MKKLSLVTLFTSLTLGAGVAAAQDAPVEEGAAAEGSAEATTTSEPAAEAAPAEAAPEAATSSSGANFKGYAQRMIDRTRTLPASVLEVNGALSFGKISVTVGTTTSSATFSGLGVGATYGVSDKIDVGGSYSFALKEFEIKGDLAVRGRYRILADDKMNAAGTVTAGYSIAGEALDPIGLGVDFHYKITPDLEVFTPSNQIELGLDPEFTVALNLPVGVGYQVNDKIHGYLTTNLATIGLKPSGTTTLADAFGFTLGGTFSPSAQLDIGASIATQDVGGFADAFLATVYGNYRM